MERKRVVEEKIFVEPSVVYFRLIEKGDVNGLKKLIEENSLNINELRTSAGNTGLMYAVHFKKKDVVRFLMNFGADTTLRNNHNETAVDIAKNDKELRDLIEKKRLFY